MICEKSIEIKRREKIGENEIKYKMKINRRIRLGEGVFVPLHMFPRRNIREDTHVSHTRIPYRHITF